MPIKLLPVEPTANDMPINPLLMTLKMVSCREIVISHLATMISHLAIVISHPAIRIEGVTALGAASPDGLGWRRSHFTVMAARGETKIPLPGWGRGMAYVNRV
jgi:hypothetical protein